MLQGIDSAEASSMVRAMFQERAAEIRSNGIRKVMVGALLMCVPVAAFIVFARIGVLPMHLFGMALAVGVWGAWMVLKGAIMWFSPKSEPGDVAEQ
jgi:hypothetical protein